MDVGMLNVANINFNSAPKAKNISQVDKEFSEICKRGFKTSKENDYIFSQQFYKDHPDLMPRNILLAEGRVMTKEQINGEFDKTFNIKSKPTFKEKCVNLFNKVKNIFK